jgi:hypothetical protein
MLLSYGSEPSSIPHKKNRDLFLKRLIMMVENHPSDSKNFKVL